MRNSRFRNNVKITTVERAGALDRYGQPQVETVHREIHGNLQQSTRFVRTIEGDKLALDGSLLIDTRHVLQTGDVVKVEGRGTWKVFTVDESTDVQGRILFRDYGLTKQRTE